MDTARVPRRLVAARIALVAASIITLLMILALPYRDQSREELVALAVLATVTIAGFVAAILITRRNPTGRVIAVTLGIYGLGMAVWRLASVLPMIGTNTGPGPVVFLLVVGSVWAAHVFAAACVLSLRWKWPPAHSPPASS